MQALTEQKVRNLLKEHTEMLKKDETGAPSFAEQLNIQIDWSTAAWSIEWGRKTNDWGRDEDAGRNQSYFKNANLTPFEMRELAVDF